MTKWTIDWITVISESNNWRVSFVAGSDPALLMLSLSATRKVLGLAAYP
ncbi:MAG: hypothetical protein CM15mV3_0140 [Caudoviricetes sp.]|nr:MAG: hypothetical protein CM15mV3_0140 [Caudoviricetes sp.]